jgi:hypothetical protein
MAAREDTVFAPGPTRSRPLIYVCARRMYAHIRGCAKSLRSVPRIRAWSPRSFPPVRTQSHPPTPLSMRLHPTRSRFYQRAHMADHAGAHGQPLYARSHFLLVPLAAACAPSSI